MSASAPSPAPSRPLPNDNKAPFRFFLHFTIKSRSRAITAIPATLPTTPPTTAEVDTLVPEPVPVPFPEAAVLEVPVPEDTAVPPPPKTPVDVGWNVVDVNALEEEENTKVDEDADREAKLEEDVRYVSDDLEERVDELAKLCDKLLELEITGSAISIQCVGSRRRHLHVVELEVARSEAKLGDVERVNVEAIDAP